MTIDLIELQNFRNYENIIIEPHKGINILYGDNGQGKTNILESICVAATTKSHRNARDKDMIRFGSEEAHIRTGVDKNDIKMRIDIHLKKNKSKGIAINRSAIKKAADLFGILNVVIFCPENLNIISDGPAERRRFMDMELCQLDKIYLSDLVNYNKVLTQRGRLLKDMYSNPSLKSTLEVWDEQLINYGRRIIKRRREFIDSIKEIVEKKHRFISGCDEELHIKYEPDTDDIFFADELFKCRDRDIRLAQTSVGPHKDDISFCIGDMDIRKFGSQGQKRTAALSLKLSEIDFVTDMIHDRPVLLLDDVLSELDRKRQILLLNSIENIQTFMTCPMLDDVIKENISVDKTFKIDSGVIV